MTKENEKAAGAGEVERERDRMDVLPVGSSWYAVKTNPRCERRAASAIRGAGFTVYLPMLLKQYRHHRHKKWIEREFSLFVGYLFVAMESKGEAGKVKGCDGVRGILSGAAGAIPIPASFVADLQREQAGGRYDRLRPKTTHGFALHDRVLIAKGAWADFTGIVSDASGSEEIKVLTELFATLHEVSVSVDALRHAA